MAESNRDLTLVTTLLILLQLCRMVSCTTITRNLTIRDGDSLISRIALSSRGNPKLILHQEDIQWGLIPWGQ
ncbi:BnaCnng04380D [Brassica napus]|uniref:BnaCnng04380D protein n=1 Tax=Brassica napus TaxID=3708 RepID=A0A078FKR7_BRANA|nr:BnaCnng04380D [Brassica napus]